MYKVHSVLNKPFGFGTRPHTGTRLALLFINILPCHHHSLVKQSTFDFYRFHFSIKCLLKCVRKMFRTNFVSASNIFRPRLFCFWDSGIMSCYNREEEGGFFSINNDLIVLIKHARKIKRSCKAHKIVNSNRLLPDKRFANFWCRTVQFQSKLGIETLF